MHVLAWSCLLTTPECTHNDEGEAENETVGDVENEAKCAVLFECIVAVRGHLSAVTERESTREIGERERERREINFLRRASESEPWVTRA